MPQHGIMKVETVHKLIDSLNSYTKPGDVISICFQGGEPTLMGLEFYRKWIEIEAGYPERIFSHSIQTNGILIDKEWAEFFQKNRFLVGISVDGYEELHDRYRKDVNGFGTFEKIKQSINILHNHKVEINGLCVVTKDCALKPHKVYRRLKELGFKYIQFIACIDGADEVPDYSLPEDLYASFLCAVFDDWYTDWENGNYTSIRLFDDFVHLLCNRIPSSCSLSGRCPKHLIVESDGSLYPCDFYVGKDYLIGNISQMSVENAVESDCAKAFRKGRINPADCSSCRFFGMCHSGCRSDFIKNENEMLVNRYCNAFKSFFSYAYIRLEYIAKQELLIDNKHRYGE